MSGATLGERITEAGRVLRGVVHHTPLLSSRTLSELCGGEILIKAEHLQRTGSFKIRGAYVRIAKLTDAERAAGVVAASAGNHAQGVAWAASRLDVPATVVMPIYASLAKVEATRSYGADVELVGETIEESLARARELAEGGRVLVHPFDDPWVIAGQATLGHEIASDAPTADQVIVPVGGGGLIAGVAAALKAARPEIRVVGVRPAAAPATIADGAAVAELGSRTGPAVTELVDEMVAVDENAVAEALVLLAERTKQVVEGAGALPLAAVLDGAVEPRGRTVLVASGGNIDAGLLIRVIRHGLEEGGRYLFVRVMLEDRPGRLQAVLALLADLRVNVVSVVHHRAGLTLPVGAVQVELTLETRGRTHADEVLRHLIDAGYDARTR